MDNRYKDNYQENTWYQAYYYDQKIPYELTIDGRIRSLYGRNYHRELGTHINSWNYLTARIRINKVSYHRFVHTLMCHTFLTIPEGYTIDQMTVNHIDGNKLNNHIKNLEWCSFKNNQLHKFDHNLQRSTRGPVDNNIYLFRHNDGREFTGSPRELFHEFKDSDSLFQQGVRNMVRGYNITNGNNVTQHKGWRKLEMIKEVEPDEIIKAKIYKPIAI